MVKYEYKTHVLAVLKETREQYDVVGPLIDLLVKRGWKVEQMIFGKNEWRVPKTPSESTKREKGQSFAGFPVDVAVFDSATHRGDPNHLLFVIECKQPSEKAGISQLECYFVGEPHATLGVWANTADPSAKAAFLFRKPDGSMLIKRFELNKLPRPGEAIAPDAQATCFTDLVEPSEQIFRRVVADLLDKVVISDAVVTRREEQLDQLCDLLLTKLESDKQAKSDPDRPVPFRRLESPRKTAIAIREAFDALIDVYPETFTTDGDRQLRFTDDTITAVVDALSGLRLLDMGVSSVAVAFQVLRSEALKQGEGQYFTPQAVIEAGVRLLKLTQSDLVIDPACGTGGFLVQSMLEMRRSFPRMSDMDLTKWAQTHIFGIEKDAVGLKLTKAIMQIAGDGSAHCARGDSVRKHKWVSDFPHLSSGTFKDGRFTVVLTNPPFGKNLKVSAKDSRLSELTIAKLDDGSYCDLEIGLLFLQRAYQLLKKGGRVGIVLPETYFFSPNYRFVVEWIKPRLRPLIVANIPMEAFQGFCRAKTNFYVFEKIATTP
jgi:type I restriction enzyme M protein